MCVLCSSSCTEALRKCIYISQMYLMRNCMYISQMYITFFCCAPSLFFLCPTEEGLSTPSPTSTSFPSAALWGKGGGVGAAGGGT